MRWFYHFILGAVTIYFKLFYKIEFEGTQNIPQKGGFLLASNHAYGFDPIVIAMGTKRMIRFLAKSELVEDKLFGWFFKAIGCVSVERGKGSGDVMENCARIINDGGILGIFPEGTRNRGEGFLRPKSGMSVIAKISEADILPCGVIAPRNIKKGDAIKICFGKIIPFEELEIEINSPKTMKAATRKVWNEIINLAGGKNEIDV